MNLSERGISTNPENAQDIRNLAEKSRFSRIGLRVAEGVLGVSLVFSCDSAPISTTNGEQRPESPTPTLVDGGISPVPEFNRVDLAQRALVILAKEKGENESFSLEQEKKVMEDVAEFFNKESYGRMMLTFDIVNWQDVEIDLTDDNPMEIAEVIDAKLESPDSTVRNSGIDLEDYQTRIYVIDQYGEGSISGHGGRGENYNYAFVYQSEYTGGVGATVHELGHAFGLGHVDGYGCQEENDYTNNCESLDASGMSTMGHDYSAGISGPQKLALGWIDPHQVQTMVGENAEVSLSPIELADGGKKLLRIGKTDTGEFYYIEYTLPDRKSHDPTLNFYIWDEKQESNLRQFAAVGSYYSDDGDEFYDKINGIRVKQLNHSSDAVTIEVQLEQGHP